MFKHRSLPLKIIVLIAFLLTLSLLPAQTPAAPAAKSGPPAPAQKAAPGLPPSIALSPAVIMAKGNFGQGLTQTLTLTNNTNRDLAFELVAEDVVVKDGKRVFVPAGETGNSIAASAVFSQKTVLAKSYSSASVDVRLTLPAQTGLRAVAIIFRGTDKLPTSTSAVAMTASLAGLVTFNLSDNVKLEPETVHVTPASETANMIISQWIANTGSEPVLPEGAAAVLNANGSLAGKTTFAPQRLLPGERLEFIAEYPYPLQSGNYRALCTFQFEGKILTTDANFKAP